MNVDDLDPRSGRDVEVLRAQGVLAERLGVNCRQADRGLRAYSLITGVPLYEVARQVVSLELIIARDLCR